MNINFFTMYSFVTTVEDIQVTNKKLTMAEIKSMSFGEVAFAFPYPPLASIFLSPPAPPGPTPSSPRRGCLRFPRDPTVPDERFDKLR